jgi:hypothetical protein
MRVPRNQRRLHRRDDPQGHVPGREGQAALHPGYDMVGIVDAIGPGADPLVKLRATGWPT